MNTTTEQRAKELLVEINDYLNSLPREKTRFPDKVTDILFAARSVLAGATETNMPNSSGCTCDPLERHGETGIMCCNHCGKPVEEFWVNGMNDAQQWIKEHSTPTAPSGVTFYAAASPDAGDWKRLFELLAQYGGKIVSTASLTPEWIEQARASGRMYVNGDGLGFVWEPDIKEFPETVEAVEWFEKWYPLKTELPEGLKTLDWMRKDSPPKNDNP